MNIYIPQVHQFDRDYPAHLPSDEELGISHINIKTNDGPSWMGRFDPHIFAVTNLAKWKWLQQSYASRGITATAWCVPTWTGDHALELEITSQVIETTNQMVFNVEFWNTDLFWQGGRDGIVPYIGELRRRFPDAHFTLQYDVRWPESIHLEDWLPYVDRTVGMDYWTDFELPMKDVLVRSWQAQQALPVADTGFTYPGDSDIYPDWEVTETPIYIFRRGNMSEACITMIQAARQEIPDPNPQESITDRLLQQVSDLYNEQVRQALKDKAVADLFRQAADVLDPRS